MRRRQRYFSGLTKTPIIPWWAWKAAGDMHPLKEFRKFLCLLILKENRNTHLYYWHYYYYPVPLQMSFIFFTFQFYSVDILTAHIHLTIYFLSFVFFPPTRITLVSVSVFVVKKSFNFSTPLSHGRCQFCTLALINQVSCSVVAAATELKETNESVSALDVWLLNRRCAERI